MANREIKFRAWDVKHKKIDLLVEEIHFNPDYCWVVTRESEGNRERFILMQYTGLKDRNGVEIYEGDLCRYIFYTHEPLIGEVKWWDDDASFRIDGNPFNMHGFHGCEVIGNIYENPELLKGE